MGVRRQSGAGKTVGRSAPHPNRSKGPGQGPAKGGGNGKPRHVLDTSPEKQRKRGKRGGYIRTMMREWRKQQEETLGALVEKPRPPSIREVRDRAQSYGLEALDFFYETMNNDAASDAARLAAARELIDRGYGRAIQQVQQLDGDGNPISPAAINLVAVAFDKLSDDELDVLIALYRKLGIHMPHEMPPPTGPVIDGEADEPETHGGSDDGHPPED